MTKLNIGMIGAGFIGQLAHLMNYIEISHCKVLALAEYKPELRRKVAERYSIPHVYTSHTELLANPDIDAVIVVTPRSFTAPVVLDCLKAGKHVLSEKPMAGSSAQGKLLLEAAYTHQATYAVGYMKRYDEGVQVAKKTLQEALQTGSLGSLLSVYAKCYMGNSYCHPFGHIVTDEKAEYSLKGWNTAPDWLPELYHQPFGAYLNTYSHVTNLLRYLFNESPSVEFVNLTDHGAQLVVLGFKNFLATLETGKISHRGWSEEIKMTFSDGEIALYMPPALLRNIPASVEIYRAGKIQERVQPLVDWSWSFRRQAEEFVADVLGNKPSRISAQEAYHDIILTENIWQREMNRIAANKSLVKSA